MKTLIKIIYSVIIICFGIFLKIFMNEIVRQTNYDFTKYFIINYSYIIIPFMGLLMLWLNDMLEQRIINKYQAVEE